MYRSMRREGSYDLGKQIVMMSTKPKEDLDMINGDAAVMNEQSKLRMLTQELEMVQVTYMSSQSEKDFLR